MMKGLIKMLLEDYRKEGFTREEWIKYGLVGPAVLMAMLTLVSC